MPKLKFSKTELKTQRDALKRFLRFLPTLELKKEQLLLEIRKVELRLDEKLHAEQTVRARVRPWAKLFSEPAGLESLVRLTAVETTSLNIAGVEIPVFVRAAFAVSDYDLRTTPLWVDRAVEVVKEIASLQAERRILEEQKRLLQHELRVTSQRVNLFEKIKIPEAKNNIRRIQIYLGDQQTSAVARGKIAKAKLADVEQPEYA
ncbi:V-type ATP synthase subunit D [bacterium]|nr:V-type ATP synthase subunit D [bacterium]